LVTLAGIDELVELTGGMNRHRSHAVDLEATGGRVDAATDQNDHQYDSISGQSAITPGRLSMPLVATSEVDASRLSTKIGGNSASARDCGQPRRVEHGNTQ
jgi:hypothetical protein